MIVSGRVGFLHGSLATSVPSFQEQPSRNLNQDVLPRMRKQKSEANIEGTLDEGGAETSLSSKKRASEQVQDLFVAKFEDGKLLVLLMELIRSISNAMSLPSSTEEKGQELLAHKAPSACRRWTIQLCIEDIGVRRRTAAPGWHWRLGACHPPAWN